MESEIEAASFRGMEKSSECLYESEGRAFVQELDVDGDSSYQTVAGNGSVGCGASVHRGVSQNFEAALRVATPPLETLR